MKLEALVGAELITCEMYASIHASTSVPRRPGAGLVYGKYL